MPENKTCGECPYFEFTPGSDVFGFCSFGPTSSPVDECPARKHERSLRKVLEKLKERGFLECVVEPACNGCTVCDASQALKGESE